MGYKCAITPDFVAKTPIKGKGKEKGKEKRKEKKKIKKRFHVFEKTGGRMERRTSFSGNMEMFFPEASTCFFRSGAIGIIN